MRRALRTMWRFAEAAAVGDGGGGACFEINKAASPMSRTEGEEASGREPRATGMWHPLHDPCSVSVTYPVTVSCSLILARVCGTHLEESVGDVSFFLGWKARV